MMMVILTLIRNYVEIVGLVKYHDCFGNSNCSKVHCLLIYQTKSTTMDISTDSFFLSNNKMEFLNNLFLFHSIISCTPIKEKYNKDFNLLPHFFFKKLKIKNPKHYATLFTSTLFIH